MKFSTVPDFPALHALYAPRVRNVIASILRYRPDDVDDAAQETWIRVWTHLPRFRANAAVYTWIHRIAVNCALGVLRKHARAKVAFESLDIVVEGEDGEKKELPRQLKFRDRRLELTPERVTLESALPALTRVQRDVYERHYVEGWTYREMTPPGRNPVTARSNGLRLRESLRRGMRKEVGR